MKHSERCAQECVRTNSRDAAFSRLRIPHAGLRKQFYGLKGRTSLVVTDGKLDAFVGAIRSVVELAHSPGAFWSEAIGLARRAFRS
jgi:hypothetical protein